MNDKIEEMAMLWNGTERGWILLQLRPNEYQIYNEESGALMHIDDKGIKERVIENMKLHGVRIETSIKSGAVQIDDSLPRGKG